MYMYMLVAHLQVYTFLSQSCILWTTTGSVHVHTYNYIRVAELNVLNSNKNMKSKEFETPTTDLYLQCVQCNCAGNWTSVNSST